MVSNGSLCPLRHGDFLIMESKGNHCQMNRHWQDGDHRRVSEGADRREKGIWMKRPYRG